MSNVAISVEGLGKRYRIGAGPSEPYGNIRESLVRAAGAPLRRLRGGAGGGGATRDAWALKDVSFEVKHGEAVGIIGRNGAGKSTLLKVLSRITEPTTGQAVVHGRVGSLLEVGTGFHPELSGRENIYLNGAVMGMSRADIKRRFDEIVDFAGVETYLDTPVKRYSSGMYMRLAFAVAAHLEPEVLVVDEVLAVGDVEFQKKCLGKMSQVAGQGRTVLFVSHNMAAIATLCSQAILLARGEVAYSAAADEVINAYIASSKQDAGEAVWADSEVAPGNDNIRIHAVRILSEGIVTGDVDIQRDVHIQIEFWNRKPNALVNTSVHLIDKMGVVVLASANMPSACLVDDGWFGKPHPAGLYRTECTLPGNFLNEGPYSVNAIVLTDVANLEAKVDDAVSFMVHDSGELRKEYTGHWIGVVRPKLAWQTEYLSAGGSESLKVGVL